MTRNMIKANQYIFKKLAYFVEQSNLSISGDKNKKRCIETNEEEKEWLQNLKIEGVQPILSNQKTAYFTYKDQEYFVVTGWYFEEDNPIEGLELIPLNAGIATALLYELKIKIRKSSNVYDVYQTIFYSSEEEIIKLPVHQVIKFFQPISIYEIKQDSRFINLDSQKFIRLSGLYISSNPEIDSLQFSKDTYEIFKRIFWEGVDSIPYENLLLSLVSVSWKHCFLEVYRCIERLYPIIALKPLYDKLKLDKSKSLLDFATDVEDQIGWTAREEETINKLMDQLNSKKDIIKLLKEVKCYIDKNSEGELGKFLYKIRNSIVHFRPANQGIELDEKHWDKLIMASLLAVEYWYKSYDPYLQPLS